MDRSKILVVGGIFLFLIIVIWALSAIMGREDPTEVALRDSLAAQETVIALSGIASSQSGDVDTQALAATITSTTTSDRTQIGLFYEERYDSPIPEPDEEVLTQLEETREGLSHLYREMTAGYLDYSLEQLLSIQEDVSDEGFQQAVDTAIENHHTHLDKLDIE